MAKGKNMLGKFRGKVGATVFRTEAGIGQIASEYNPNPKNPRTMLQTQQRGKMSLAGEISKTVSRDMLAGLDANGRKARSLFVSTILKACRTNVRQNAGSSFVDAMVEAEQIKFSKGVKTPLAMTKTYNAAQGKLTLAFTNAEGSNIMGVRAIVLVTKHNHYNYALSKDLVLPASSTANLVFDIPAVAVNENDEHSGVHVYTIPMVDNGSDASTSFAQHVTNEVDPSIEPVNASTFKAIVTRTIAAQAGLVESNYEGFLLTDAA